MPGGGFEPPTYGLEVLPDVAVDASGITHKQVVSPGQATDLPYPAGKLQVTESA